MAVEFFYGNIIDVRSLVTVEDYGSLCQSSPAEIYRPRGQGAIEIPFGVVREERLTD